MTELKIELEELNSQDFFGQQNRNINKLRSCFPKLKIVARGSSIKAYGEEKFLKKFHNDLILLIDYFNKYNSLDEETIGEMVYKNILKKKDILLNGAKSILHGVGGKIIKPITDNQIKMVSLSELNDMVFAIGPAGTGKTYTAIALAVKALKEKKVKRIILTKPAIEAGENLGFLPGDLKEKLDPYIQPLYDSLHEMIPSNKLSTHIKNKTIEIAPLAYMRGRTLDEAFVILDEAQNTTHSQMKMFLTRMGRNAKFIITGDPGQIDLPKGIKSGLKEALMILKATKNIGIVKLNDRDVIRHSLVKKIIKAYEDENNKA
ncbi:MAG: PhoH family protein [Bacteroidota bacterium]|nr:PhoH family protein [Bacteroidota bacterium]